jgi:V-type H+-transporting ATPase subunit H
VAAAGTAAVEAGLERAAAARAAQAWADPDLPPLLAALGAAAADAAAAASTWDAYRAEVLSGRLRWGPAHTSPAFWAEHGSRLEDRGLQVLKVLVAMLQAGAGGGGGGGAGVSTAPAAVDATTLAVACADVASYLAAVPHGRSVLADLGGKAAAMRLLAHADPEVRRHALAAVQRLVLPREVLGGGGVGEVVGAMAGVVA